MAHTSFQELIESCLTTQGRLARAVGCSQQMVSKIALGQRLPSPKLAVALAAALRCGPKKLAWAIQESVRRAHAKGAAEAVAQRQANKRVRATEGMGAVEQRRLRRRLLEKAQLSGKA